MSGLVDLGIRPGDIGPSLLRQSTYWKTWWIGRLQLIHVDDMSPSHRRAVLAWLLENAEQLQAMERAALVRQYRAGQIHEVPYACALNALDRTPPEQWIRETTLVRRLQQLVPHEPLPARGILRRGRGRGRGRRWGWRR